MRGYNNMLEVIASFFSNIYNRLNLRGKLGLRLSAVAKVQGAQRIVLNVVCGSEESSKLIYIAT